MYRLPKYFFYNKEIPEIAKQQFHKLQGLDGLKFGVEARLEALRLIVQTGCPTADPGGDRVLY